jgi:hypothetical protein
MLAGIVFIKFGDIMAQFLGSNRCWGFCVLRPSLNSLKIRRLPSHLPGDDAAPADGDDIDETPDRWSIHTASALSRVGLQIQKALMEERIISLIIEWCDTPKLAAPGVCYRNVCILIRA